MTLDDIDKTGLIREAYRIPGITAAECRSIFLGWAITLPAGIAQDAAIQQLLDTYRPDAPDHPMTSVLVDGLGQAEPPRRRGGRRGRVADA